MGGVLKTVGKAALSGFAGGATYGALKKIFG